MGKHDRHLEDRIELDRDPFALGECLGQQREVRGQAKSIAANDGEDIVQEGSDGDLCEWSEQVLRDQRFEVLTEEPAIWWRRPRRTG